MIGIVLSLGIPLYTVGGIITYDNLRKWWEDRRVATIFCSALWPLAWLAIGLVGGLVKMGSR
jgi:hypothetical protein